MITSDILRGDIELVFMGGTLHKLLEENLDIQYTQRLFIIVMDLYLRKFNDQEFTKNIFSC